MIVYSFHGRCGIPVVIMGETGCGKTRLVKFMCTLENPNPHELQNMVIMKVCLARTLTK